MKIDFVSDIACPWCAIGLNALERALERLGPDLPVELHFQPFELNPQMPAEGEDTVEHLSRKYGLTPEQLAKNREALNERGLAVGFRFGARPRIWNTFDGHRLLHWAGLQGPQAQRALKHALLQAYHGEGRNPGAPDVLLQAASAAGLDAEQARAVIESNAYADEVRAAERHFQQLGIQAVPSVIVDGRHLIQGGQPPEVFEQALRRLAASEQAAR
ncbi:DsbA family oxidoreductase [Aquincola sp. S2]|uniref:DsbA family oxidoreductase n=1 Tax=Pseudaquabacterium terrae TaxID=2732868 RepID=A0ABX2ENM7_9BURK|nr:DsbA family oxidoreductase [Aquabacterium terrae]NRF70294.1 DsbA family oxidoreductase [Aquabacterium terrae]